MAKKTEKKKILLIIYKLEVGGAEKVVQAIACGIDKNKYKPIILCFKGGRLKEELIKQNFTVYDLHKKHRIDLKFILRFILTIKRINPDLIHSHSFSANFWARLIKIFIRKPIIITEHTIASHKNRIERLIDRFLQYVPRQIIAVSNEVKKTNVTIGKINEKLIKVIYNGIEFVPDRNINNLSEEFIKEYSIGAEQFIYCCIGRLEKVKGLFYLIEAAKKLRNEIDTFRLLIVGDGSIRIEIEEQIINNGLTEVAILTGFRNDVYPILHISDVFISSSLREGFSVSVVEAMALKNAIIATNVGGNKEAIDSSKIGILVPPKSSESLYEAMKTLYNNRQLVECMGKEARRKYKKKYKMTTMINEIEKLYRKCLQ